VSECYKENCGIIGLFITCLLLCKLCNKTATKIKNKSSLFSDIGVRRFYYIQHFHMCVIVNGLCILETEKIGFVADT
jgi:hypothetical protein